MKKIDNFIIERLKINKESKPNGIVNKNKILDEVSLSLGIPVSDNIDEVLKPLIDNNDLDKKIKNWIVELMYNHYAQVKCINRWLNKHQINSNLDLDGPYKYQLNDIFLSQKPYDNIGYKRGIFVDYYKTMNNLMKDENNEIVKSVPKDFSKDDSILILTKHSIYMYFENLGISYYHLKDK